MQDINNNSQSLHVFFPDTEHYMTYEGSTTAPGCHETVTWIVLNKPIYITLQQVSYNITEYYHTVDWNLSVHSIENPRNKHEKEEEERKIDSPSKFPSTHILKAMTARLLADSNTFSFQHNFIHGKRDEKANSAPNEPGEAKKNQRPFCYVCKRNDVQNSRCIKNDETRFL